MHKVPSKVYGPTGRAQMLTGIIPLIQTHSLLLPHVLTFLRQGCSIYSLGSYNQLVALFFFFSGTQKVQLAPNGTNWIKYGIEFLFLLQITNQLNDLLAMGLT